MPKLKNYVAPSDEIMEWTPFWKPPVPEITRQIGKALRKKGFSIAREFCGGYPPGQFERNSDPDNAYAGDGKVDKIVTWLIEEFNVVKDDKQYPGFVNLLHKNRLIHVKAVEIGKYQGRVLVVLPFIPYNIPDGPPKREE